MALASFELEEFIACRRGPPRFELQSGSAMTWFEIVLLVQASATNAACPQGDGKCDPWAEFRVPPISKPSPAPEEEKFGPGPHTLVISDMASLTKLEYRSGAACKAARDAARRQVRAGRFWALCVPR